MGRTCWMLSAVALSALGMLIAALDHTLGLDRAVAVLLLGLVAIGVSYSIWKALHWKAPHWKVLQEEEREKPFGFLRDVVNSVVPLLALLGVALVFQGFGELVNWDAAGAVGRTVVELFGGS